MATTLQRPRSSCDGFRVESADGVLGWVEEAWLGPREEPSALAVRTPDGRRGLLVADDVAAVIAGDELVLTRLHARLLELEPPHAERSGDGTLVASWRTTGATLEPLPPAGLLGALLPARRPWRRARPAGTDAERPLWQSVALLYVWLSFLVALVTAVAFLAAYIAAGSAV